MNEDKPRDQGEAEQLIFDALLFPEAKKPQPPKTHAENKPCGNLGYCYCPKCNPR